VDRAGAQPVAQSPTVVTTHDGSVWLGRVTPAGASTTGDDGSAGSGWKARTTSGSVAHGACTTSSIGPGASALPVVAWVELIGRVATPSATPGQSASTAQLVARA